MVNLGIERPGDLFPISPDSPYVKKFIENYGMPFAFTTAGIASLDAGMKMAYKGIRGAIEAPFRYYAAERHGVVPEDPHPFMTSLKRVGLSALGLGISVVAFDALGKFSESLLGSLGGIGYLSLPLAATCLAIARQNSDMLPMPYDAVIDQLNSSGREKRD